MNDITIYSTDNLDKMMKFAETLAASSLVPVALRNKPQDIVVVLQTGLELGLKPMQSLQSIHVIQGTPTMSGRLMLALIRSRCPRAFIKIEQGANMAKVTMARSSEKADMDCAYTATWDLKRAEAMGLLVRDQWKKQPGNMLLWRAVSEAARFVFSDIIMNAYVPDEAEDGVIDADNSYQGAVSGTVEAIKGKFAGPEEVVSISGPEEISVDHEAEADVILQIPNRDYVCPIGVYKGKRLCEIPFQELKDYMEMVDQSSKGKAMSDVQKVFVANASSYVKKYEALSLGLIADDIPQEKILAKPEQQALPSTDRPKSVKDAKFKI
jgi:hypothetical protein